MKKATHIAANFFNFIFLHYLLLLLLLFSSFSRLFNSSLSPSLYLFLGNTGVRFNFVQGAEIEDGGVRHGHIAAKHIFIEQHRLRGEGKVREREREKERMREIEEKKKRKNNKRDTQRIKERRLMLCDKKKSVYRILSSLFLFPLFFNLFLCCIVLHIIIIILHFLTYSLIYYSFNHSLSRSYSDFIAHLSQGAAVEIAHCNVVGCHPQPGYQFKGSSKVFSGRFISI